MGQFYGWAPQPYREPGKFDWLNAATENYFAGKQRGQQNLDRRQEQQDIQAMNQPGFNWDAFAPQSPKFGGMQMQLGMQNQLQRADPLRQAQTEYYKQRAAETGRPPVQTPTQGIAQAKLDLIKKLQTKKDAGSITKPESEMLKKMLGGVSPVHIDIGSASPSERTAIAETNASIDALNNLKTLYNNVKTKSGPIVGRTSQVLGLVGMTSREQEDFMAATFAFQNAIIKDITGAQMSEVEANRIRKQIPLITDPPARWEAKWEQSLKNLEFLQRRRKEVLRQSGLKAPGSPLGSLVPRGTIGSTPENDPLGIR